MVELVLFLSTFCLFFFVPVQFRIFYSKVGKDDHLLYELSFLLGLIKRQKEVTLIKHTAKGTQQVVHQSGRWFMFQRSKIKQVISPFEGNSRGLREFLHRFEHYGLGVTLLTYFLPAKYHRWLLVVDDLEKKGRFVKFVWYTRFGTGEAASTAILNGVFWGVKASLLNYLNQKVGFGKKPEIMVIPDYQLVRLDMVFDCIFKVKLGYIIIAAFIARLRHRLKGGVGLE